MRILIDFQENYFFYLKTKRATIALLAIEMSNNLDGYIYHRLSSFIIIYHRYFFQILLCLKYCACAMLERKEYDFRNHVDFAHCVDVALE